MFGYRDNNSQKLGIRVYKNKTIPKRNERKVEEIKVRSDRLYRKPESV